MRKIHVKIKICLKIIIKKNIINEDKQRDKTFV